MILLLGILGGIALSLFFSFGPAFFSLLQTSIQYGYRRSIPFPLGIFASDAFVVFLLLTLLKDVDMAEIIHNPYVAIIGGIGMGVLGVMTFRKKVKPSLRKEGSVKFRNTQKTSGAGLFWHGFAVNFLNPLIWIYWLAIIALISGEMGLDAAHMYLFFIGLLGTTLGLDILKCKLASLLQSVITDKMLNLFNKITGCVFFAFAAYLIISMVRYQRDPSASQQEEEHGKGAQAAKMLKGINEKMHDTNTLHLYPTGKENDKKQ